ncbi:MAG: hypothetical protein LBT73_01365 [Tannerellaceae bacterium]|nr:hypothetical protein [Tannerellaceae bacterium]
MKASKPHAKRQKLSKARKEYLSKLFADYSKAAFTVLVIGGIAAYFLKPGEVSLTDIISAIALGLIIAVSLGYAGYRLTSKDNDNDRTD